MLRLMAIFFGIAFIFAGVAGFLPAFTVHGYLFDFLEVDTIHNIVHIVSGVIAIMAATNFKYTKLYFLIFGIIYSLVAIVGFWRYGDLYLTHVNTADNFLNLGIGVLALYLGLTAIRRYRF
jgi:hypothetical protein